MPPETDEPLPVRLASRDGMLVAGAFANENDDDPTRTARAPPPPPPPGPEKNIHNEVTKLKANTLNAVAIAFFVSGGVVPLVSLLSNGLSVLQTLLGLVWVFVGFILHSMARKVLEGLVP